MEIDLNLYSHYSKFVKEWYARNSEQGTGWTIGILAASTFCPCIAIAFYLAEDLGFTPQLVNSINILIDSYGYKKILNQQPGSPFAHYDIKD